MVITEALVVLSCVTSKGCQQTSDHYYVTHPELRQIVKYDEEKIKNYLGPFIIEGIGPVLYAAAGGTGTVRLNRYFSLQINRDTNTLSYRLEF